MAARLYPSTNPMLSKIKISSPALVLPGMSFITENRAAFGYAYQVDQPITGVVTGLTSNPPFALPISIATQQTFAALPALFNGTPSSVAPIFVNPNFKNADVQSWNLNIQQQLTRSSSVMIGYFGNKGTHLENDINANQTAVLGQVGTGATNVNLPFQSLSPNSPFLPGVPLAASITERESGSNSNYNALGQHTHKRFRTDCNLTLRIPNRTQSMMFRGTTRAFRSKTAMTSSLAVAALTLTLVIVLWRTPSMICPSRAIVWSVAGKLRQSSLGRPATRLTWLHSTRPASMVLAAR